MIIDISSDSVSTQVHNMSGNGKSSFPNGKVATIALCVFTLSNPALTSNIDHALHLTTSKNKIGFSKVFGNNDEDGKNTQSINLFNGNGGVNMSEIKLNEVQRYFDDKISVLTEKVHVLDKRTALMEKDITTIKNQIDDIPNVIKNTIKGIEDEKRGKLWDRFIAPVIVGLIVPAIFYFGPMILKYLK